MTSNLIKTIGIIAAFSLTGLDREAFAQEVVPTPAPIQQTQQPLTYQTTPGGVPVNQTSTQGNGNTYVIGNNNTVTVNVNRPPIRDYPQMLIQGPPVIQHPTVAYPGHNHSTTVNVTRTRIVDYGCCHKHVTVQRTVQRNVTYHSNSHH